MALREMEYGYVYPYYYPPSESAHTAVRGQLSAAQSVSNTTTVSTHMGQSLQHAQLGSGITLGNQSPAVGVSVNISGSTDTVSMNFMSGGHHLDQMHVFTLY